MMFPVQVEPVPIPKFNFSEFITDTSPLFGIQVYHWLMWLIIFVFTTYIFNKVFRSGKLPVLKALLVYALLAFGGFMLLIFEVDANLPIIYSLFVAVSLIVIVRIRYWIQNK